MNKIIEVEDKAYVLGYAEGYSLARDFGDDLPKGAPRPLKERVHDGQDWKQGRKDGYEAGLCDRRQNILFDHSLHTKLGEPHDWANRDGSEPKKT